MIRIILSIGLLILIFQFFTSQPEVEPVHLEGKTMGSIVYNVKYTDEDNANYKSEVDSILISLNNSLSTYINDSEISRLNQLQEIQNPSGMFTDVRRSGLRPMELLILPLDRSSMPGDLAQMVSRTF